MRQSKRGSILLEALLTVSILSISLTVIIQALMSAYRASRMGWRYSEAAMVMENTMIEKIYQGGIKAGVKEEGRLEKPFNSYRYRFASQPVVLNGVSNENINDVIMSIEWDDGSKKHTLDLQTFLFNTSAKASDESHEEF